MTVPSETPDFSAIWRYEAPTRSFPACRLINSRPTSTRRSDAPAIPLQRSGSDPALCSSANRRILASWASLIITPVVGAERGLFFLPRSMPSRTVRSTSDLASGFTNDPTSTSVVIANVSESSPPPTSSPILHAEANKVLWRFPREVSIKFRSTSLASAAAPYRVAGPRIGLWCLIAMVLIAHRNQLRCRCHEPYWWCLKQPVTVTIHRYLLR